VGVGPAEGDFLAHDHDDPAVGGPALDLHGLEGGSGWWPCGAGAAEAAGLLVGEGAGSGAQQVAGV
jgi:hypothetical protein